MCKRDQYKLISRILIKFHFCAYAQCEKQNASIFHLHCRFAMSANARRDAHCDKNEAATKNKRRCFFNLQQREAHKGDKHLKPALSWIVAKKLPALPINGYICRRCRHDLHKVSDIHMGIYNRVFNSTR